MAKGPQAFRTISEASTEVGVAPHVLRFWETRFPFVAPMTRAGGRRFYRPSDVALLRAVRVLLHERRLGIKAVQALHRKGGARAVLSAAETRPVQGGARSAPQPTVVLSVPVQGRLRAVLAELEAVRARVDRTLAEA